MSITYLAEYLRKDLISHTRKVQSLYKRILRNKEAYEIDLSEVRYEWALVRAEFEKNRHVKDMRVAKMLLEEAEHQLFLDLHPQPKYFTYSPGGPCFERYYNYSDHLVDVWHPYEKARFPFYLARRELRKKEMIEMWEKGNNPTAGDQHSGQHSGQHSDGHGKH